MKYVIKYKKGYVAYMDADSMCSVLSLENALIYDSRAQAQAALQVMRNLFAEDFNRFSILEVKR